jgi:hypothetical protein
MSTTNIVVDLSSELQGNSSPYGLQRPGVFAYAVYFETATTTPHGSSSDYGVHYYTLVSNGAIQNGGSTTITLPTDTSTGNTEFDSGKIYFIVQSGQPNGALFGTSPIITQESDINWTNAQSNDYRYDSVELNLSGQTANQIYDVANLTSVNGFGLPMTISNGLGDTRGYNIAAGTSTDAGTLFKLISDASVAGTQSTSGLLYSVAPLSNNQRMMLSPAESVAQSAGAFTNDQWNTYIGSLKDAAAYGKVAWSGWYNGSPDANGIWHNAGFFDYRLSWDGSNFWLKPTTGSQIKGDIKISDTNLAASIYATNGNADIWTKQTGGSEFLATMNTGANNQWGEVFVSALTGFTAGYYGATAKTVNPTLYDLDQSKSIDLSKTWNWDPTYAFGNTNVTSGAGDVTPSASVFYDKYSQAFFNNTNSYGGGYSDALMKAFSSGGPLMTLYNGTSDVPNLTVHLFADDETPGSYVTPRMYNYIAPPIGGYKALDTFNAGANITFSLATSSVMVKEDTPVSIAFWNGSAFTTPLQLTSSGVTSIYQTWTLNSSLTSWNGVNSQVVGTVNITGVPVTSDGSAAWYQLTVGSGASAKTFNIYAKSDATSHQFLNPSYTGQADAAMSDGLGIVAGAANPAPQFVNALSVSLNSSSGFGVDSTYLTTITDATTIAGGNYVTPWAPVIGSVDSSDVFTNLSGFTPLANTKANKDPGWVMPTAPTTKLGELAFGWNGSDTTYAPTSSTPDTSKVYGYTNKLGATNVAEVNFTQTGGGAVSGWVPTVAVADLDGRWHTDGVQFGNGTFKVTMTEYQPTDVDLATPIERTSQFQSFTVSMDDLLLATADSGHALSLDNTGHTSTLGNWIRLTTSSSTLPNGTLVAYATNGSGQMLDHDGNTTSSLHDATLARIGSVVSDGGAAMFSGAQSVYLPVGQQMHFAIVTGNGTVDSSPTVSITGTGGSSSYTVGVSDSNGALSLTAQVVAGNTLTSDAVTAAAQRNGDTAWLYLTKGATVDVDTGWSSGYVNALHFVKIDVDATTGGWSVNGVAYGDTDAFRTAVQSKWEFSASHGNGTGSDTSATWTVAGDTGYYAPVLVNGAGVQFNINNGTSTANADGREHIRMYGENVFGFEDKVGGDWDYNDMVLKLSVTG